MRSSYRASAAAFKTRGQGLAESSTSCCLASMTAVCLLRTCFSTYSLPTNSFWLSLQPHLPHQATPTERECRLEAIHILTSSRDALSLQWVYECTDLQQQILEGKLHSHSKLRSIVLGITIGAFQADIKMWAYFLSSIFVTWSSIHSSSSC